jgi:alanyl-tRNA synthetase
MMTSTQIRQSFLDFFKSKQHTIVPSSSLMPDSPNLLFTNAGMNQFVPIFLGQTKCPYKPGRAADTQKCIRAGGKHNDLEDVGLDTYHHTFFEMLGNWSFGDYFKKEAIEWAWELVTSKKWFGFPPERLYATVYKPGPGEPSECDDEAWEYWTEKFIAAGLDSKVHVCYGGKKDNFWMMGDTGPCGPCSEIHVDLTPEGKTEGKLVNKGDARCIEIWNLVFIQFNANPDGTFSPLPARHVDTGMGFERVTGIIQCTKGFKDFANAKISNYETDIFRPIFDKLEELSGKRYGSTLPQFPGSATVPVASVGVPPAESAAQGARYYKRRLPHFERPWAKYMVSFSTRERRQLSPAARDIVLKSLLFGHEQRRYQLYAACVMADHVHFLFEPQIKEQDQEGKPVFWPLAELLHSIKSFTAHEVNKSEGKSGQVWENESFDRMIRGDADLEEKFHYICRNPWDSGATQPTENYPWLWTPDAVGSTSVSVTSASGTVTRDAQQGDQDGRAPHSAEQIQVDIAFRVIADHIRTLGFAIADGIQPGNNDRNYVLRRILRRAVRYGRTLGFHEPFFYKLVDVLADTMGDIFPEIRARKKNVREVIRTEEEAFNKTLDKGIEIFNEYLDGMRRDRQKFAQAGIPATSIMPGRWAFTLYDTYGFPLDLTQLMAREHSIEVAVDEFDKLMEEQRTRARAAQKKEVISLSQIETTTPTKFVGYDTLETDAKIIEVVKVKEKTVVILDTSVFYAEMGGQIGDTGKMVIDECSWEIINTQKSGNTFLHFLGRKIDPETRKIDPETPEYIAPPIPGLEGIPAARLSDFLPQSSEYPEQGAAVELHVNISRRNAIQRHHTVTHLLHWALHEVVNKEASQKGSFVGPDKLTFDFNSQPLTPQQVADIEKIVNERILENAGVSWTEVPYADVKSRKDVRQFFGDKYGDTVRVVQIGGHAAKLDGYSMELCGGTHTRATGEIGLFRIVGENAIAAGVRRIEAVAGLEAYRKATDEVALIKLLAGKVNSPVPELEKKIESLLEHQKAMEKQIKIAQQREASNAASNLLEEIKTINGVPAIIHNLGGVDGDFLQAVADSLKSRFKGVIVLGGGPHRGSVALVAAVTPEFTAKVQAGKIIQTIAPIVGGKGGGKPDNARGGGKDAGKLDEALAKAKSLLG